LSILNEQSELKTELSLIEREISSQEVPDADAIKSKMNHAIARLRTETDPHELFELRATINSTLRDSVRLYFGRTENDEVAVFYTVQGEKPAVLVYGDEDLELASSIARIDESKRLVSALGNNSSKLTKHIKALSSEIESMEVS